MNYVIASCKKLASLGADALEMRELAKQCKDIPNEQYASGAYNALKAAAASLFDVDHKDFLNDCLKVLNERKSVQS